MSKQTFDRSSLDRLGRDELQQIASSAGLKGISRLKKADLIDRIVSSSSKDKSGKGSPSGGNGAAKKTIRSTRSGAPAEIEALAAEEEAISSDSGGDESEVRPMRRSRPVNGGADAKSGSQSSGGRAPDSKRTDSKSSDRKSGQQSGAKSASSHGSQSERDRGDSDEADRSRSTGNRDQGRNQGGQNQGRNQGGQNQGGQNQGDRNQGGGDRQDDGGQGNRRRRRRRGRSREREQEEPQGEPVDAEGLLDLRDEGYGFLRTKSYLPSKNDAYVSASQVRRFGLRKGDFVKGATRAPSNKEKYPALMRVDSVNGMTTDESQETREIR